MLSGSLVTHAPHQVETVARSVRIAGELGTEKIPADMKSTESHGGPSFTVVDNAQALKLAAFQA